MSESLNDDSASVEADVEKDEENENRSLQRYSRTKLYALRNNKGSQQRPDCASRSELQTLYFWKSLANNSRHERTHGGNIGYAGNDLSLNSGATMLNSQFSMNSTNPRTRERQTNARNRPLIIARCGNANRESPFAPSEKSSFLDQRTNSITHLMPAFAKKQIAAAAAQKPTTTINQQSQGIDYSEAQENDEPIRQTSTNYNDSSRILHDVTDRDNNSAIGLNTRHSINLHERRIGSGRLLPRDVSWDYNEKNASTSQIQRPLTSSTRYSTERTNNNLSIAGSGGIGYTEKNSFDRKSNAGSENYSQNASNRRYNLDEKVRPQRHNFKHDKNDEPEWYSGGPTSQNDVIELRGFDDPIDDTKTEHSSENAGSAENGSSNADLSQSSSNYELATLAPNTNSNAETETETAESRSCVETPNALGAIISSDIENKESIGLNTIPDGNLQISRNAADMSKEFNFDAFLNLDTLDSQIMHTDDQKNNIASSGSRFSRWFANSNTPQGIPDENASDKEAPPPRVGNVLEFFQNAKLGTAGPQKLEMPSVEELEAKMRKVDIQEKRPGKVDPNQSYLVTTPEGGPKGHPATEDMEAFKRILQQLNDGGDTKRDNLQHELIPHCFTPLKQALMMGFPPPPEMSQNLLPPPPPHLMPVTPENYRFASPMSPSQHIHMNNPNTRIRNPRDILVDYKKQIDFVNLVHAVNRGQIPLIFLEKELSNPNVPIPTKELIAAVIHEIARSFSPVPAMLRRSPINQNHQQRIHSPTATDSIQTTQIIEPCASAEIQPKALIDQIPQTTSSPLGMTNPQDRHARSQALMQNALIKKKIEEHQMGQNRRQSDFNILQADNTTQTQMQCDQQSPQHQPQIHNLQQPPRHLNSPTPIAFTPTSVLRKMTADKDNNTNAQIQQHHQQQQQQQFHKLLHETQNKPMNLGSAFLNQNPQQLPSAMQQPRMILGGNQIATSQQQPQHLNQVISPQTLSPMLPNLQQHRLLPNEAKWQMNMLAQQQQQQQALNKPMGRPILKGPPSSLTMPLSQAVAQQQPMHILGHLQQHQSSQSQPNSQVQVPPLISPIFPGKLDISQQQQRLKNNQTPQHMLHPQSPAQGFVPPPQPPQHLQQPISQMPPNSLQHMQQQQLFHLHHMTLQQQQHMQLQRQLHQQLHSQPTTTTQPQQHETKNRASNFPQPQQQAQPALSSPINNAPPASVVCPREGDLSPTSNQLAQWFSPELLAQASAGKLPQINMNQALSLEEFERNIQQHSSTVVHN